jgi:hypothetical protein
MTSVGLIIGLLVGGIITHMYDRSGFHRIPGAVEMAIAGAHQAQHQARANKQEPAAESEQEAADESEPQPVHESSSEQT